MDIEPGSNEIVEGEVNTTDLFDKPGDFKILDVTPEKTYQLGTIHVSSQRLSGPLAIPANNTSSFYTLKENKDIISQIQPYTKYLNKKPEFTIVLTVNLKNRMSGGKEEQCKVGNYTCNIEWNVAPAKVKMNEKSTQVTVDWILKDNATGKQLNITNNILQMKLGDIKKIRLYNDPNSAHPMQHPIHIHTLSGT